MKKKKKPIEIDAHFKYRCSRCTQDHWISLLETKTKNFKIVCYCGKIIIPKQIKSIKIQYFQENIKDTKEKTIETPTDILDNCCKILINYGFTKAESINLINNAYTNNITNDCALIIKYILENLEKNNEH